MAYCANVLIVEQYDNESNAGIASRSRPHRWEAQWFHGQYSFPRKASQLEQAYTVRLWHRCLYQNQTAERVGTSRVSGSNISRDLVEV